MTKRVFELLASGLRRRETRIGFVESLLDRRPGLRTNLPFFLPNACVMMEVQPLHPDHEQIRFDFGELVLDERDVLTNREGADPCIVDFEVRSVSLAELMNFANWGPVTRTTGRPLIWEAFSAVTVVSPSNGSEFNPLIE